MASSAAAVTPLQTQYGHKKSCDGCSDAPSIGETRALLLATLVLSIFSLKEDFKVAVAGFALGLAVGANVERLGFQAKAFSSSGGCSGTLPVFSQSTLPWILTVTYLFFKELSHLDHGAVNVIGAPFGLGVQLGNFLNNLDFFSARKG